MCLGNICRSPLAEGIFLHLCRERGLDGRFRIDSAGTGDWHCGHPADPRALEAAAKHGVALPSVCRQVKAGDFAEFDLIIPMDRDNRKELLAICPPGLRHKVKLMREFEIAAKADAGRAGAGGTEAGRDANERPAGSTGLVVPGGPDVPDPYFGGPEGFDEVYALLLRCCNGLLDSLAG